MFPHYYTTQLNMGQDRGQNKEKYRSRPGGTSEVTAHLLHTIKALLSSKIRFWHTCDALALEILHQSS